MKVPIYEYKCNKCGNSFEQIVFPSDDEGKFECPSCGDKDINRLVSSFSSGSSGSGESLGSSISSGCSPSGGFS
ncbi:zinc ribbon domain-containing protein [Deltaproteobacteria bacterium]|nr:zinc ribbon domain-containing protein [Deltaproteobacteria bacterium]